METRRVTPIKKNFFYRLPVLLYCLFIFYGSSFPPEHTLPLFPFWFFSDKVLHFGGYALLGFLVIRALEKESFEISRTTLACLAIGLSTLYGISDEIHQAFVPVRDADVLDAVADALGSAAGVVLFLVARAWSERRMRSSRLFNVLFFY